MPLAIVCIEDGAAVAVASTRELTQTAGKCHPREEEKCCMLYKVGQPTTNFELKFGGMRATCQNHPFDSWLKNN